MATEFKTKNSSPNVIETAILASNIDIKVVQDGFTVVALLGCALAMFKQTNFAGLLIADVGLLILMMLQLKDLTKVMSVFMTTFPSIVVIAMITWYAVITRNNQTYIETDSMPDQWEPNSRFISAALIVHILLQLSLPVNGIKMGCFGWLTMTIIVIFVAMQFILAENFRTNG